MLNFDAHKQRPLLNHPPWLNHGLPMPLMQTLQKKVCLFQTSPAVNSKINLYCLHYDIVVSFRSRLNQKSYSFPFCTLFINGFQLKSVINGTIRFYHLPPPQSPHNEPTNGSLESCAPRWSIYCSVLALQCPCMMRSTPTCVKFMHASTAHALRSIYTEQVNEPTQQLRSQIN